LVPFKKAVHLLKPLTTIYALIAGLLLAGICILGIVIKSTILVFIASHFLPGLTLGLLIVRNITKPVTFTRKLMFVLSTTALYTGAVVFLDLTDGGVNQAPITFIVLSSAASWLLVFIYDLLILKEAKLTIIFLLSLLPGLIASVPGALCLHFFPKINMTQTVHGIYFWIGLFSIFPLWFLLFAWYIQKRYKLTSVESQVTA
jgi:hypothetical protein